MNTPKKLALLASLYFCQGLPFGFFTQWLPVWLRQQGHSLAMIGLTAMLALPWALKFLWAPWIDRHGGSRLGRRRAWIVPLQLAAVAVLLAIAWWSESMPLGALLVGIAMLNAIAATQDIATDGLAVDLLKRDERGWGNGVQVAGYRVGMIVGGGALLVVHQAWGARRAFLGMALLLLLGTLPVLRHREAPIPRRPAQTWTPWWRQPRAPRMLALVFTYKTGEALAAGMLRPWLVDAGHDLATIGSLLGTVGFAAGLVGALAGGAAVGTLGRRRALVGFGVLQAAAVAAYAAVAHAPHALHVVAVAIGVEHFASGMATAALFTCMMDACRPEVGASDYTFQASAVVWATGLATSLSGFVAQALGYPGHFGLAAALTLGAALAALGWSPRAQAHRAPHAKGAMA